MNSASTPSGSPPARMGMVYMGVFLLSTLVIVALQETDAINRNTGLLLFLCAMTMMIPAARAIIHSAPDAGAHAVGFGNLWQWMRGK